MKRHLNKQTNPHVSPQKADSERRWRRNRIASVIEDIEDYGRHFTDSEINSLELTVRRIVGCAVLGRGAK